jgi:carbonic anhydrase
MPSSYRSSRREFIKYSGLAAGAAGLVLHTHALAADASPANRDPNAVLARLLQGNKRFASGQSTRQARKPADFAADAQGQAPLAIIVGCADSRVAPELVFDQGTGELFVVRVAGNVVSGTGALVKGSIEYAVAELGARLIMVLGHSGCGAVKAAIEHIDGNDKLPGSIGGLVDLIKPAVVAAKGRPGDQLTNVIRTNVERCVARLKGLDPILSKLVDKNELKVAGATYELSTGAVEVFV